LASPNSPPIAIIGNWQQHLANDKTAIPVEETGDLKTQTRGDKDGEGNGSFGKNIALWHLCKRGKGANVTNSDKAEPLSS